MKIFIVCIVDGDKSDSENEDNPTLEHEQRMMEEALAGMNTPRATNSDFNKSVGFDKMIHQNYPIVCKTFTDPASENDKVLMVVSLPGGSENIRVELDDEGLSATIKYAWTKSMYDVADLFKKQLGTHELTTQHPMLVCFKQGLTQSRKKIDVPGNITR